MNKKLRKNKKWLIEDGLIGKKNKTKQPNPKQNKKPQGKHCVHFIKLQFTRKYICGDTSTCLTFSL